MTTDTLSPVPPSSGGGKRPDDHLIASILATCFCCMPLGIIAIVQSCRSESLYRQGRYEEALRASNSAADWGNLSFILGFIGALLGFACALVSGS